MSWNSLHVSTEGFYLPLKTAWHSHVCFYHHLLNQFPLNEYLCYFQSFVTKNNVRKMTYKSFPTSAGIPRSKGICICNFVSCCHISFHMEALYSYQLCLRVSIPCLSLCCIKYCYKSYLLDNHHLIDLVHNFASR